MARVYLYVVDRDFGFAPNPFHGCCTLATCKPGIRLRAEVADWIIDLGPEGGDAGGRIVAAGTPEAVSQVAASHTGRYLRDVLAAAEARA